MAKKNDTPTPTPAAPAAPAAVEAAPVVESDTDPTWAQYSDEERALLHAIGLWDGESSMGSRDEIRTIARGLQFAARENAANAERDSAYTQVILKGPSAIVRETLGRLGGTGKRAVIPPRRCFGYALGDDVAEALDGASVVSVVTIDADAENDGRGIVIVADNVIAIQANPAAFGFGSNITASDVIARLRHDPSTVAVAVEAEPVTKRGRRAASDEQAEKARERARRYREEAKQKKEAEAAYAIVVADATAKGEAPPPPPAILTKPKGKGGRKPKAVTTPAPAATATDAPVVEALPTPPVANEAGF
jgi:sulfur carrier protein ThiS